MPVVSDIALGTTAFVELLGAAVLVAIVAERIRLPAAVALVGFGAIISSLAPVDLPFTFGPALLFIFLPPLIFEAAWNLDASALRRMAWSIAIVAVPGVLLTTGVIALGLSVTGQLPFIAAFMFGTIVSATDPVGVIAIFRRLNVPLDLLTLVEGESIANDGVAIALYGIALALRGFVLTAQGPEDIDHFWEVIAFVANAVVFLATGLLLQIPRVFHEPLLVLAAIAIVFASRAMLAFGVLPLLGIGKLRAGWRETVFFAGMRGALSLALALGLPASFPYRNEIVDATFAVVLVTLVVQGATIETFLKRLPLAREKPGYGGS